MATAGKKEKTIQVPKELHKLLIGPGGQTLQNIQKEVGGNVKIQVPKREDPPSLTAVVVQGDSMEHVDKALKLIRTALDGIQKGKETLVKETEKVYQEHQKAVDALAQRRNELFQEASKAFERGDKAKAKLLSDEGHRLTEQMKSLQQKSAEAVYAKRQQLAHSHAAEDPAHASLDAPFIDLHGLHVAEGLKILEKELLRLSSKSSSSASTSTVLLRVVTGKGLHSPKDKGPQLKPSVESYFQTHHIAYSRDPDEASFLVHRIPPAFSSKTKKT